MGRGPPEVAMSQTFDSGDAEKTVIDQVAQAIGRGEYLDAFERCSNLDDESRRRLSDTDTIRLHYYRCLALARAGSRGQAATELGELHLHADGLLLPADLTEDLAALAARLAKDAALAGSGDDRRSAARVAAERYESVYQELGRPFSCVNAATLYLLAGDEAKAQELATAALSLTDRQRPTTDQDAYWQAATQAEASAVLGDQDAMALHLARAGNLLPNDFGARSTTMRQMAVLVEARHLDPASLDPLRNPIVIHYCGHRVGTRPRPGRFAPETIGLVRAGIERFLDGRRIGAAHGSLAAGADVLIAEACIARGIDLHVVLPFSAEEFVGVSVSPSGVEWVSRFWDSLESATSVRITCEGDYLGDDVLFGYASEIAMGSARNRAEGWTTESEQLAVWDGMESDAAAGTAHDVRRWRAAGGTVTVIDPGGRRYDHPVVVGTGLGREIRPVLFGDLKGFSRLSDRLINVVQESILQPLAEVLRRHGDAVLSAKTWGDGLMVVLSDVGSAAAVALELQSAMAVIDLAGHGLPPDLGLRLGGHAGPVFPVRDPISNRDDYAGREVVRAARIEPRTPEGEVYVTAAFAALLALEPHAVATPEYVGTITTAKGFETVPMYVLTRNGAR